VADAVPLGEPVADGDARGEGEGRALPEGRGEPLAAGVRVGVAQPLGEVEGDAVADAVPLEEGDADAQGEADAVDVLVAGRDTRLVNVTTAEKLAEWEALVQKLPEGEAEGEPVECGEREGAREERPLADARGDAVALAEAEKVHPEPGHTPSSSTVTESPPQRGKTANRRARASACIAAAFCVFSQNGPHQNSCSCCVCKSTT